MATKKGFAVYIHSTNSYSYQYVWHTFTPRLKYMFRGSFGALWPVPYWWAVKHVKHKRNKQETYRTGTVFFCFVFGGWGFFHVTVHWLFYRVVIAGCLQVHDDAAVLAGTTREQTWFPRPPLQTPVHGGRYTGNNWAYQQTASIYMHVWRLLFTDKVSRLLVLQCSRVPFRLFDLSKCTFAEFTQQIIPVLLYHTFYSANRSYSRHLSRGSN